MAASTVTRVNGTNNSETLTSTALNSQVYGLGGDDTLIANDGSGTLYGGAGVDAFQINHGGYTIYDFTTGEQLDVAAAITVDLIGSKLDLSDTDYVDNLGQINITGTKGADDITGSAGVDFIVGGSGNDTLSGSGGDDTIQGGAGSDKLYGDNGDDELDGGAGNDTLTGGYGDDLFIVSSGIDTITDLGLEGDYDGLRVAKGAVANVTVYSLDSHENEFTNDGKVNLYLYDGAVVVDLHNTDGTNGYTITAKGNESGADVTGSNFSDTIIGGDGNDSLSGGNNGSDILTGGLGGDRFQVDGGTSTITDFGVGADTLVVYDGTAQVTVVADFIANGNTYNDGGTAILNLTTAATNVSLAGADDYDGFVVNASKLATSITGSTEDDTINGGAGKDMLDGHSGDDVINGGAGNDTIYGQAGDDTLDGGIGADTMIGGDGDDVYYVDNVGDRVVEDNVVGDYDTVRSTISFDLGTAGFVERLELLGKSNLNGTGNGLDNELLGNSGNNVLDGGAGDDLLDGDLGNDKLIGGSGDDEMWGGAGNDVLNGDAGNDSLAGGTGADSLTGGSGDDAFGFAAGDSGQATGFDKVLDFDLSADSIVYFNSDLNIGGTDEAATSTQASIDSNGVATFAAGSGIKMADALGDIAARFAAAGDAQGDFALFQLNNKGDYYLFISDGVFGVTANDVVVQLVGVTGFGESSTVTEGGWLYWSLL